MSSCRELVVLVKGIGMGLRSAPRFGRGLGCRVLGFRGLGFIGFRGLGFRG